MGNRILTALKLVVLLLPVVVLSALVVKAEMDRYGARLWTINIQGFDPRDLLHGQYLQFRFDWEWADGQPGECVSCCVCLQERSSSSSPVASLVSCDLAAADLPQCGAVIRKWDAATSTASSTPVFDRPFRFYIPEQHAGELQKKLNNFSQDLQKDQFSLRLNVTPEGQMMFRDLLMNGQPYIEGITQAK